MFFHSNNREPSMFVRTQENIDHYLEIVRKAADDARAWIPKQTGDPLG
jgi:hypothetical protein